MAGNGNGIGTSASSLTHNRGAPLEWRTVCLTRLNVVLEGPACWTEAAIQLLQPHFRDPVLWTRPQDLVELQDASYGTLVLRDIDSLGLDQQARLLDWMVHDGRRTQAICTTPRPLFPLVQNGQFSKALYYRLNTVLLRADAIVGDLL